MQEREAEGSGTMETRMTEAQKGRRTVETLHTHSQPCHEAQGMFKVVSVQQQACSATTSGSFATFCISMQLELESPLYAMAGPQRSVGRAMFRSFESERKGGGLSVVLEDGTRQDAAQEPSTTLRGLKMCPNQKVAAANATSLSSTASASMIRS